MVMDLSRVSGSAFALMMVTAGTAYAGGGLVTNGTVGNCAAGQICTVAPVEFGADAGGLASISAAGAVEPHGRAARRGPGPHHGNGGGSGDGGGRSGGMGGGGMGGGDGGHAGSGEGEK